MHIAFLDEFGHIGPFVSRHHEKYKTSPVFGVSGFIMPEESVRHFSTWYFQLKENAFPDDIIASDKHPSAWEKKGHSIFTGGRIFKTKRLGFALINKVKECKAKIFFPWHSEV